jgi:hypothetical protein
VICLSKRGEDDRLYVGQGVKEKKQIGTIHAQMGIGPGHTGEATIGTVSA